MRVIHSDAVSVTGHQLNALNYLSSGWIIESCFSKKKKGRRTATSSTIELLDDFLGFRHLLKQMNIALNFLQQRVCLLRAVQVVACLFVIATQQV